MREEKFKEDFWLIGEKDEKIAIGECKTFDKEAKRTAVKSVDAHRDEYDDLPDGFPAVTVVNANLKASSWEEKLKPIHHNICELAQNRNVLLIRIEDLVFFAYWCRKGKLEPEELKKHIREANGWLEVTRDGSLELHS
jgi:hypothetical protein